MNFSRKTHKAKLATRSAENGLRGAMQERNYYAAETASLFVAELIDERLGFVERCDLTRAILL